MAAGAGGHGVPRLGVLPAAEQPAERPARLEPSRAFGAGAATMLHNRRVECLSHHHSTVINRHQPSSNVECPSHHHRHSGVRLHTCSSEPVPLCRLTPPLPPGGFSCGSSGRVASSSRRSWAAPPIINHRSLITAHSSPIIHRRSFIAAERHPSPLVRSRGSSPGESPLATTSATTSAPRGSTPREDVARM